MPNISDKSTIQLERNVIELLKKVKDHPRETYNQTIEGMAMEKLARKGVLKAKDVFGMFPRHSSRSAQEIKDDARRGWH